MEIPEIIKALRRNMVETGSLICIGCGREHNCSIHGCAIMREAADALERLNTEKQDTDAHLKAISDSLSEQMPRPAPENNVENSTSHLEQAEEMNELAGAGDLIPDLPGTDAPENKVLTVEQLRKMEGEPVWCDWINGWGIINIDGESRLEFTYRDGSQNTYNELVHCGIMPLAYARKPEQKGG